MIDRHDFRYVVLMVLNIAVCLLALDVLYSMWLSGEIRSVLGMILFLIYGQFYARKFYNAE